VKTSVVIPERLWNSSADQPRGGAPVQAACPHCGKGADYPDDLAGLRVPCRFCDERFALPMPAPPVTCKAPFRPADWLVAPRVWRFGIRGLLALSIPIQVGLHILSVLIFSPLLRIGLFWGLMITVPVAGAVALLATAGRGREARLQWRALAWVAALAACAIAWGCTNWSPPSVWVLVNYVSLTGVAACLVVLARIRWPSWTRRATWGALSAGVALLVLFGWLDRYDERWTGDRGIRFIDTYGRFTSRWNHRWVFGGAESYFSSMHGPMTGSWKKHGEWTYLAKEKSPPTYGLIRTWYWYGEKISEGEWHLRNK
jgi:hypothetical protein